MMTTCKMGAAPTNLTHEIGGGKLIYQQGGCEMTFSTRIDQYKGHFVWNGDQLPQCMDCGALAGNVDAHTEWHRALLIHITTSIISGTGASMKGHLAGAHGSASEASIRWPEVPCANLEPHGGHLTVETFANLVGALGQTIVQRYCPGVASPDATADWRQQPSESGEWRHDDGSACDAGFIARQATPTPTMRWWCTEHGKHLVWHEAATDVPAEPRVWDDYREEVRKAFDADEKLNYAENGVRLRDPAPMKVDPRDVYYMLQAVDKAHEAAADEAPGNMMAGWYTNCVEEDAAAYPRAAPAYDRLLKVIGQAWAMLPPMLEATERENAVRELLASVLDAGVSSAERDGSLDRLLDICEHMSRLPYPGCEQPQTNPEGDGFIQYGSCWPCLLSQLKYRVDDVRKAYDSQELSE